MPGTALTPPDIVKFASGYALWVREESELECPTVVIGRDARPSGSMVSFLVSSTLNSLGVEVIDLGLSTTPTVELAVPELKAQGGIILTASHNPKNWNALKLLDASGEFLSKSRSNNSNPFYIYLFDGGNYMDHSAITLSCFSFY